MSALIQLAQMKIQLALVQKQLAFWTQLAYNFRHCHTLALFDAHEMVCVEGDAFEKVYDPHSHSSSTLVRV